MSDSAKFEVSRVLNLSELSRTVLAGRVVSGAISKGMAVQVWVDGGLFWTLPVQSVELIDGPGDLSEVALMLPYQEGEDLDWLVGLCPTGTTVDVAHASSGQA